MGCCCLDHRPSQPYTTLSKIDPATGDILLDFDLMHPYIGDQSYDAFGMVVSAWVSNGFVYQASLVAPDTPLSKVIVVTCCATDSNSTIWIEKLSSTAVEDVGANTNLRVYADVNYVWIATGDDEAWCLSASDGDIISTKTGLQTGIYNYLSPGYNSGTVFFGDYVEYNHEFTATQSESLPTTYDLQGLWEVDDYFIAWHNPGKVYRIYKSDLSSPSLLFNLDTVFLDYVMGASSSLVFVDESTAGLDLTARDYSGTIQYEYPAGTAMKYYNRSDATHAWGGNGSNKLVQINLSDGSTDWTSTLGPRISDSGPRQSVYDPVNDQYILQAASAIRPHDVSTGSVNWVTGRTPSEYHLHSDGYLYVPFARRTI